MKNFTKEQLLVLKESGWYNGRKEDITEILNELESEGFTILDSVIAFLSDFNGIYIDLKAISSSVFSNIDFDSIEASYREFLEVVLLSFTKRINCKHLCPIGMADYNHVILYMDENGNVYGASDQYLRKIGNSGIEAIYNIMNGTIPNIVYPCKQNIR